MAHNLTSSDGRGLIIEDEYIKFQTPGMKGVVGLITGEISCSQGTSFDIRHEFEILGNIPIESNFEANINSVDSSVIEIPLEFEGGDSQMWLVGIDGPLSRVAETDVVQELEDGSVITLEISPSGLLSDGMIGDSLTDTFGSDLDGSFGSMPGSLGAGAMKFKAYAEANGVDPSVYVGESYDAAALIVLAMALGGSDDSATVAANIMSVANGPGTKIYAGELAKGLELASAGFAVDYDGATDVNFTEVGEAFGAFIEKGIEGGAFTDAAQR